MKFNMKRYFIRAFSTVLVAGAFIGQSCTDLSEDVYNEVLAEDWFQTQEEFIAAVGQAYASLAGLGNHSNLWSINEISSDELVITTKGGDWYDGGVLLQLHQHTFQPDNGFFNNAWSFMYGGVNTCNRLINIIEGRPDDPDNPEVKVNFIAELRALRALWYYWLLDSFGNVPLVTTFVGADPQPPTTPRAQVYAFVESELLAVLDNLPTAKDASTYGRMTRWAALSILTKLYLNAEVYTGTAQWQKCIDAAQEIVDDGGYILQPVYADNFIIANGSSVENILVYPYDKVFATGFNWPMMTLHYASQQVYNFTAQPWNGYSTVEEFYNSYIDTINNPGPIGPVWRGLAQTPSRGTLDSRLTNFVVGPQFNPDGSRATDPGYETPGREDNEGNPLPADPDGAPLTFTPQINEIFPNGLRQAGARIGKYEYEFGGTENMSNDFVIFRYGDILLSLAEAHFRLGQTTEALTIVNQIRARAEVDPFTTLTLDNLLAERGREMYAEMTRRQDLIRFGRWDDAWWEKEVSDPKYRLFPIPTTQRNTNGNLEQNPGY